MGWCKFWARPAGCKWGCSFDTIYCHRYCSGRGCPNEVQEGACKAGLHVVPSGSSSFSTIASVGSQRGLDHLRDAATSMIKHIKEQLRKSEDKADFLKKESVCWHPDKLPRQNAILQELATEIQKFLNAKRDEYKPHFKRQMECSVQSPSERARCSQNL